MKKIIVIMIALALLSVPNAYCGEKEPTKEDLCKSFSKLANIIMQHRQLGTPMSLMMDTVSKDKPMRDVTRKFIIEAYDTPRFSAEENKQRAIQDFENEAYLDCIKSLE